MALTTERVNVILDVDADPLIKQIRSAIAEVNQLDKATEQFKQGMTQTDSVVWAGIGDMMTDAARRYFVALKDIGTATSNFIEQANFAQKVFGDAYDGVLKFAEAASAIGFSKTSALNAAAALGVFGKTAGLAGDQLVTFTEQMVTLAADMASIRNTTPEEAIIALAAAMRSEYEPLRRYGVVLNDVQLRQRAFNLGIYDGTGALNSSQRILAARAEVMDQLSFAMGDFIDTQDQFANSQRRMRAELENAKIEIGEGILPIMLGLTKAANLALGAFNSLPSAVQGTIGVMGVLAVAALAAAGAMTKLVVAQQALQGTAVGAGIKQVTGLIAGPAGLTAAILAAWWAGNAMLDNWAESRVEAGRLTEAMKELAIVAADLGKPPESEETLAEWFKRQMDETVAIIDSSSGRPVETMKPLSTLLDDLGFDFKTFGIAVEQSLDMSDEAFNSWAENVKKIAKANAEAASPGAADKLITFIEKLRLARPELAKNAKEQADAERQLNAELERQGEALEKTYQSAVKAKNSALKDLAEAKSDLIAAQTKAQKDLDDAWIAYWESIASQERAIQRQKDGIEGYARSVQDAERAVVEAIRNEEEARRKIDDAIQDQADAVSNLQDTEAEAVQAREDLAKATDDLARATRGYGAASQEAADALEALDDAQLKLRGSQLGLQDSTLALADAQTQLDRLRRFYGNTSSPSALRRIADAERAVARAQLDRDEAIDALESSTKDVADAQKDYNYTVNGFPADSERVRQAMDNQKSAADRLETSLDNVRDAQRRVVDSQRAVDEAYRNADSAARGVEDAQYRVAQANRDAQYAADDLRRAEWELAAYRNSKQPQYQAESVRAAEDSVRQARADLASETYNVLAAEQALAAFRLSNMAAMSMDYFNRTPQFMNGYPPAGSFGTTATININVQGLADPYTTGKYIADTLTRYLRATGQMPQYGSPWPH